MVIEYYRLQQYIGKRIEYIQDIRKSLDIIQTTHVPDTVKQTKSALYLLCFKIETDETLLTIFSAC